MRKSQDHPLTALAGATVQFRTGVYHLREPLALETEDGGMAATAVHIMLASRSLARSRA